LVLFPITGEPPPVTRGQLLSAVQIHQDPAWQADTASGPIRLLPFSAIGEEQYTTYLTVV
jgi:hypothetical protein